MQWVQLNYHLLFFGQLQDGDIQDGGIQIGVLLLSCTHATLCRAATFDHYYLKTAEILLDSPLGSHFESIVLVIGSFQSLRICYYKRLVH